MNFPQPLLNTNPTPARLQNMRMSFWFDVRPAGKERNLCFDVSTSTDPSPVALFGCHGMKGNQMFRYRLGTRQLFHPVSELCLDAPADARGPVFMSRCSADKPTQRWHWQHLNETLMEERNKEPK